MVMPQNVAPRAVGYNKELFGQAGLDPNRPPVSWDELIQYTRRLTRIEGDRLPYAALTLSPPLPVPLNSCSGSCVRPV